MYQKTPLFMGILLLGAASAAQSAPLYYTFEGSVTNINEDDTGAIAAEGLTVGSTVNYTFLVDPEIAGFRTMNDGTVVAEICACRFFADYIQGSALPVVDGGYFNQPWDFAEYNFGYDQGAGAGTFIQVNSSNNFLQAMTGTGDLIDWGIGTVINNGFNRTYDSTGAFSTLLYTATLTNISTTAPTPVPLPGAIWLLGSALLGLVGWKYPRHS